MDPEDEFTTWIRKDWTEVIEMERVASLGLTQFLERFQFWVDDEGDHGELIEPRDFTLKILKSTQIPKFSP